MKKLLIAIALLLAVCATDAYAKSVMFTSPNVTVTMLDEPCAAEEVLALLPVLPDTVRASLRSAMVVWQGQGYKACWFTASDGTLYVLDETGDAGALLPSFGRFETLPEA